jgi:hypothetical protein
VRAEVLREKQRRSGGGGGGGGVLELRESADGEVCLESVDDGGNINGGSGSNDGDGYGGGDSVGGGGYGGGSATEISLDVSRDDGSIHGHNMLAARGGFGADASYSADGFAAGGGGDVGGGGGGGADPGDALLEWCVTIIGTECTFALELSSAEQAEELVRDSLDVYTSSWW